MEIPRHYRWARTVVLSLTMLLVLCGCPFYAVFAVVGVCLSLPFVADIVCRWKPLYAALATLPAAVGWTWTFMEVK